MKIHNRLLITGIVLMPHLAAAQAPASPAAPPAPAAASKDAAAVEPPQGFTYNAEGRRDPFVNLMRRGVVPTGTASNPSLGIAGVSADDVNLRGVLVSRAEYVGIVQGTDSRTFIVRAGQKLLDGTIRIIDKDSMVIMQQVNDPLSLEKQRELRKVLRQDEAK
jgi:Tfp pilus assembly protein PilP